ncbi:MAG: hypothetical protein ABW123_21535 [Cystobacter sp.]
MAALVLGLTSGCEFPEDEVQARRAQLEADEARLDKAFDTIEARLLGNQARLHLWRELEERHGQVSAIQCRVSDEHLKGMATLLQRQQEKARAQRMASASTVLSSAFQGPLAH